jgi:hypothetical protein
MSRGLVLSTFVLVAAMAVPVAGGARLDSGTYDDPTGDSGAAPDIQQVLVGSHATAVTLGVKLPNRQRLEGQDSLVVPMDTDGNPATGQSGVDYVFAWDTDPQAPYALFRWDGTKFADSQSQSLRAYFTSNGARISFSRADVGNPARIQFWVETSSGGQLGDSAPNEAILGYTLSSEALALRVNSFVASKRVKPGKRFAAAMNVHRSDLDELSSDGAVTCNAKVGRRTVKVAVAFPENVAACAGTAPRWAKGKTLKVTVALTLDGVRAQRTASILVR